MLSYVSSFGEHINSIPRMELSLKPQIDILYFCLCEGKRNKIHVVREQTVSPCLNTLKNRKEITSSCDCHHLFRFSIKGVLTFLDLAENYLRVKRKHKTLLNRIQLLSPSCSLFLCLSVEAQCKGLLLSLFFPPPFLIFSFLMLL